MLYLCLKKEYGKEIEKKYNFEDYYSIILKSLQEGDEQGKSGKSFLFKKKSHLPKVVQMATLKAFEYAFKEGNRQFLAVENSESMDMKFAHKLILKYSKIEDLLFFNYFNDKYNLNQQQTL